MQLSEEQAAWQLFCRNWIVLGLMAAALGLAMAVAGFSIAPASALAPFALTSAYLGLAYYNSYKPDRRNPRLIFILASTGQILIIPALMAPMTYVAAAANLPMHDVALNALDHALGLDWMAHFDFVYHQHALLVGVVFGYSMIGWPVFGVPIALGWTGRYRRLQKFTLAFAIALIVTTIVSAFVPAMGTYDFLHYMPDPDIFTPGAYLRQLRDLPMVRDGSLRHLELDKLVGIVSFPSFHAAAAVLYLWALWPVRWIGPIAAALNVAMLLATPIGGGHYFVDIFAGIAVAGLAILAAKWTAQWLLRPAQPAAVDATGASVPAE